MSFLFSSRSVRPHAILSCLLAGALGAAAGQVTVSLDIRALGSSPAGPFYLGFQLADGSQTGDGNNAVVVSNVQVPLGSLLGPGCPPAGNGPPASISLTDLNPQTICYGEIVPGTSLSFDVSYTGNTESGAAPADEFVMVILDRNMAPIPTTGGVALLQIDFDSPTPTVQTFAGDPSQPEAANGGSGIPIAAPIVAAPGSVPGVPTLLSPANGAVNVSLSPILSWSAAANATSYDIYLGAGGNRTLFAAGVTSTFTGTYSLPFGATYSWQVVARNLSGSTSSSVSTFTTVPPPPSPTGASPGAGSGLSQTFSFTFNDPNGVQDLSVLDVLINNYLDGIGACYFALVPAGPNSGYLYLVDDAGDGGYVSGTPLLLPASTSLHNSQCSLNGVGSSISASGNTLTLTLSITFSPGFAGNKIFYMAARTNTQNSGWQALGTWNVPGSTPSGPWVTGASPARSGGNSSGTYTFTFTDTNGYQDLKVLDILINSFLDGIQACYFAYVPTSATTGYLYLVDDAGDGGYVPGSPMPLTPGGYLSNNQCSIFAGSASASGNTLTFNVSIYFYSSLSVNQVIYAAARNGGIGNSGWQAVGSITVP